MTKQEIEAFITQFPIYQYVFVNSGDIEFTDKVRTICKRECPRYASSWSCPPAVGTLEKCKARCMEYSDALFFSSVADVKDYSDMSETLQTKTEHEKMTGIIEKHLKKNAMLTYTLSSDSCSFCEKCSYPKNACRHPDTMHPCIESHGIVVPNLIDKNQMDYFLGERLVLWFSLIFFKES